MDHPTPPWSADPHWTAASDAATGHRYADVYQTDEVAPLREHRQTAPHSWTFTDERGLQMRITAHSDRLLRIRYSRQGFARDHSYALRPEASQQALRLDGEADVEAITLTTPALSCRIHRQDLRLEISERSTGQVILAESAPYLERSTVLEGVRHRRLTFAAPPDEVYYGLGDKSWHLNLRGRHFQNWNSDSFGFHRDLDPLYRSIPFYYGVVNHRAYGLFLHNTYRTHFDFDSQADGLTRIWAEGGETDYFFLYGPSLDEVAQSYHLLTGTPELPPLWALGFHQCRWSYYPEARVRELAREFREQRIPCDAIYLDIDYMDGYRCFTWNRDYFPDPGKMIRTLREEGFQTVVMIDPGIRVDADYAVYQEGLE